MIFKEATRLEADFWEMGWRAGQLTLLLVRLIDGRPKLSCPFSCFVGKSSPPDPSREIHVQHVLLERCGIAADADQKPSLGRLGDDCVQRLGAGAVIVEGRRAWGVQRANVCSALSAARGPAFERRQPADRVRDAAVQALELRRLEMIGAGEPVAEAHRDRAGPASTTAATPPASSSE